MAWMAWPLFAQDSFEVEIEDTHVIQVNMTYSQLRAMLGERVVTILGVEPPSAPDYLTRWLVVGCGFVFLGAAPNVPF